MNHVFVRRLIGIGAVVSALFAVSVTNISGAHGMPVPVGATTAAGYAGYWIASQVTVDGYIADANAMPASSSTCLLYTSPSPRDRTRSRMPSSA